MAAIHLLFKSFYSAGVVYSMRQLLSRKMTLQAACLSLCLLISACGGGGGSGNDSGSGGGSVRLPDGTLKPAEANSPYAATIIDCVTAEETSESCTQNRLPLIDNQSEPPTIDQILAQTVVSHDWMAERLRQYLNVAPADIRRLMGGVTAVVIASDIRPSFYTTLTGAIYLDPANLWLTNSEKATIDQDPDFRAGFGSELGFVSLWRYVDGNQYAWDRYRLDGTEERGIADIVRPLSQLLFHELAHANDFVPPQMKAALNPSDSILVSINRIASERASNQLANQAPLNSDLLRELADVLFRGADATQDELLLTPSQVGLEFEIDGASDDYSYSSQFEDVAMLFEEIMMHYHFGIDREVAYTNRPGENALCDDYVVAWGYRNRISEPHVLARAESVLQWILGENDVSRYLESLPEPRSMLDGVGWCTNLSSFGAGSTVLSSPQKPVEMREGDWQPPHHHPHRH